MAQNFPDAPSSGQIFQGWKYDGAKWIAAVASGDITGVAAGTGLTGGGTSGDVSLALSVPVSIANGGTGATTAGQALTNLAAAPIAAPAFTGNVLMAGSLTLNGNLSLATNNSGIYGKKTGGAAQFMFAVNTADNLVIGDGLARNNLNGSTVSSGNNLFLLGDTGAAFSNVLAYALTNLSDEREKTDIADLPADCLDLIHAIKPKRYKFRDGREEDKDRVRWGLIAQEVDGAMKNAGHDFGGHFVGDDENQTQGLSYADLTAVLWKAVQELSAQVSELQAKVGQ